MGKVSLFLTLKVFVVFSAIPNLSSTEIIEINSLDGSVLPENGVGDIETTTSSQEIGNETKVQTKEKPFLLPDALKPLKYDLELVPILDEDVPLIINETSPYYSLSRFDAPGKVRILLECVQETDSVILHAHHDVKINPDNIMISEIGGADRSLATKNISRDNETDFLTLEMVEPLCAVQENKLLEITIPFVTRVASDRLNGLYLDYYIDPRTKEKRYLSTTLFAPNHARKAFPCLDEPRFKANFSIKIGKKIGSNYSSISNMPPIARENATQELIDYMPGYVWEKFETTPPIPTYIVAMITTDFASRTLKNGDIEIKLHAPEHFLRRTVELNATNYTSYSPHLLIDPLNFVEHSLNMWRQFGMPYPLRKLDIIALPHFFFNAMENIGAITFKYPVILNVGNVTTVSELLRLNFVAGHEIAHQVFGNMLTPSAWNYVWLKESFSDYFGRRILSLTMHEVLNEDEFLNKELQIAMRYDQGADTHPLNTILRTSSDVGEIYTDIPYRKGASIVRMMESFLTYEVFMDGLKSLFDQKKFGNIHPDDLFQHLQTAQKRKGILEKQGLNSSLTVKDLLSPFVTQCGYPVVSVRRENGKLYLRQKFYKNAIYQTLSEGNGTTSTFKVKCRLDNESNLEQYWWIPLTIIDNAPGHPSTLKINSVIWMPPNEDEILVELGDQERLTNVHGYFRVLYSDDELSTVLVLARLSSLSNENENHFAVEANSKNVLTALERSQLLDDYFAFAFYLRPHERITEHLFSIIHTMMPFETEQVVWKTFFSNLELPYKLFQDTEYFKSLRTFILQLTKPLRLFLEWKQSIHNPMCEDSAALARQMKLMQFKSMVMNWLSQLNEEEFTEVARIKVRKFISDTNLTITVDEQSPFFCSAVKNAQEGELDAVWGAFERLYFSEEYSVQRDRYLKTLSCTRDESYLKRLLSWTANDTLDFHDIDRVTLIKYVIANPVGRRMVLDFLSENFDSLYKSASVANPVTEALKALTDYTSSPETLQRMTDFIERHQTAMEKKKKFLEKTQRKAMLNLQWVDTMSMEIQENLEKWSHSNFERNSFLLHSCMNV